MRAVCGSLWRLLRITKISIPCSLRNSGVGRKTGDTNDVTFCQTSTLILCKVSCQCLLRIAVRSSARTARGLFRRWRCRLNDRSNFADDVHKRSIDKGQFAVGTEPVCNRVRRFQRSSKDKGRRLPRSRADRPGVIDPRAPSATVRHISKIRLQLLRPVREQCQIATRTHRADSVVVDQLRKVFSLRLPLPF